MVKQTLFYIYLVIYSITTVLYGYGFEINNEKATSYSTNIGVLTEVQKIEDFNYLWTVLRENYPYFEIERRKWGYDWCSKKEEFLKEIEGTKDNLEYYAKLQEILMKLQNVHTNIVNPYSYKELERIFSKTDFYKWREILSRDDVKNKNLIWDNALRLSALSLKESLPFGVYYVQGEYVAFELSGVDQEVCSIPNGVKILSINEELIDDYVKGLSGERYLKYDFLRDKIYIPSFTISKPEHFFSKVKYRDLDGSIKEVEINSDYYTEYTYPLTNYEFYSNVMTKIIKTGKIAYIGINSFNYDNIQRDKKAISEFLNKVKDYENIVIDIRGNGGGADSYWSELLVKPLINKELSYEYLCVYRDGNYIKPFLKERTRKSVERFSEIKDGAPLDKVVLASIGEDFRYYNKFKYSVLPDRNNNVGFKGKVFLLVDSGVYSSAENFAIFSKNTGFATLVGTVTGGDGIGIDPIIAVLPNSGLVFRFPAEIGITPDNKINEETHTYPNNFIETTYFDAIEKLQWEEKRKNNDICSYDTQLNFLLESIDD